MKLLPLILGALIVVSIICVYLFGLRSKNTKYVLTNNLHNSSPSSLTTLLFEKPNREPMPGSPTGYYITDAKGNILKDISSKASDAIYSPSPTNLNGYISYSRGILFGNQMYNMPVFVTKMALLDSGGTATSLSSNLVNKMEKFSNIFVISNNAFLALVVENQNDTTVGRYSEFDAITGKENALFNYSPVSSLYQPYIQPKDIDPSGHITTFLVSDITINSQIINGTAVAKYDLLTNKLSVTNLPLPLSNFERVKKGQDPGQFRVDPVGLSLDGNILVYQASQVETTHGISKNVWVTHIYNIALGKDVTANTDLIEPAGLNSFFFSPDNKFVVLHEANSMDIVSVNNGKIFQHFNLGNKNPGSYPHTYNIEPIGWIDNNTFAYITEKTDNPGSFNPDNASSHTVNVVTHAIKDFPQNLGSLRAIIYK